MIPGVTTLNYLAATFKKKKKAVSNRSEVHTWMSSGPSSNI